MSLPNLCKDLRDRFGDGIIILVTLIVIYFIVTVLVGFKIGFGIV